MKHYDTLIFDLDGTLAISKQDVTEEMAQILAKATQSINVVIITGGAFDQIKKQVINRMPQQVNLINLYILPTSGSTMKKFNADTDRWDTVYELNLNIDQKQRVMKALKNALTNISFTIDSSILKGAQIEDRESQITFSALGQQQLPDIKKDWDPDYSKRKELVYLLSDLNGEFNVKFGGSTSIDITLAGIDKAFGINEFYKHVNFDIKNGFFIGDEIQEGGNDFAAIKTGIDTQNTSGPEETIKIIQKVLEKNPFRGNI